MIDLMFAAALSGMRTGLTTAIANSENVEFALERHSHSAEPKAATTRPWPRPNLDFTQESECPIFFTQEIAGFGTVRVGPHCANEQPK